MKRDEINIPLPPSCLSMNTRFKYISFPISNPQTIAKTVRERSRIGLGAREKPFISNGLVFMAAIRYSGCQYSAFLVSVCY